MLVTFLISAKRLAEFLFVSGMENWRYKVQFVLPDRVTVLHLYILNCLRASSKGALYLSACIYCCHRKFASLILGHITCSLNLSLAG